MSCRYQKTVQLPFSETCTEAVLINMYICFREKFVCMVAVVRNMYRSCSEKFCISAFMSRWCEKCALLLFSHVTRQVSFRKRATNYRALLRKETHEDRASNASSEVWEVCTAAVREVGGWGRVPFSRNLMTPTPRRKWYLTTGRRAH